MKKEQIYVVIDSEPKRLRAIQILSDAGENMGLDTQVSMRFSFYEKYLKLYSDSTWLVHVNNNGRTEITLDQLEQLLNPKEIKLDALKLIAESYGFELVEKKREIKVGDFGKFSSEKGSSNAFGFLYRIISGDLGSIYSEDGNDITTHWSNFRHLTDEEKLEITENW